MDAVVDTNVVSFLFKRDTRALLYKKHLDGRELAVSFATVAELYRWTIQRSWGKSRIGRLRQHLQHYTIIPFDDPLAWDWARVTSIKGQPIAPGDAWIAATAIRLRVPLITHNPKHFSNIPNLSLITEGQ